MGSRLEAAWQQTKADARSYEHRAWYFRRGYYAGYQAGVKDAGQPCAICSARKQSMQAARFRALVAILAGMLDRHNRATDAAAVRTRQQSKQRG